MFWLLLFLILLLMCIGGAFYLITRFHRFSAIERLGEKHKVLSWLASIIPLGGIACFGFINMYSVIVVMLHLIIFWLIADLIARIVQKITKKERRHNIEGACVILFTAVYLCIGWYNAHHVVSRHYDINTGKAIPGGSLRIVGFADSHIGITLDGDGMAREIKRMQKESPDTSLTTTPDEMI